MPGALQLIKALSEPIRIRFYLLLKKTPLTVSELSDILDISQSNTSHHIKALRELDLLTAEKTGQHTYYALKTATVTTSKVSALLSTLEEAADEIPEVRSDSTRLRSVLAQRTENEFARWRMEQPDLPYSDVFAHLAAGRRGCVLDVGCGEGDFFESLLVSYEQLVAIDLDAGHTRRAHKKARTLKGVNVLRCDAQQLAFADKSFDAVVLRMALSQIPDWESALKEAARTLKTGGFLSIIDSDVQSKPNFGNFVKEALSVRFGLTLESERRLPRLFMLRAQKQ